MTLENSPAMELQDTEVSQNPIQVLAREGHSRLASILRELVANLPQEFPTPAPGSRSTEDGTVVFTPFRPPPLDQGTWMDRARQVAIAAGCALTSPRWSGRPSLWIPKSEDGVAGDSRGTSGSSC
jgi:hypothetical protein